MTNPHVLEYSSVITNGQISGRMAGIGLWLALILILTHPPGFLDLQNAPILLLLISTVYSLFLPLSWSLLLSAVAVLVLNYEWVPPIKTLSVDLRAHGILLITITLVSWILAYLLRQQKEIALQEQSQASRTMELMQWSETLRAVEDPQSLLPQLYSLLKPSSHSEQMVLGFSTPTYPGNSALTAIQREGYLFCLNSNNPLGFGTGRYETQPDVYLPFRGRTKAFGACVLINRTQGGNTALWLAHAQALCDQMGLACERRDHALKAEKSRESAQLQETRSLFLAAIAHDQRTPLASVITSATAILDQTSLLSADEIRQYAKLIATEASQMARLTENTLSLARLSGQGVVLEMEPESAEDIVSAVFQRLRLRGAPHIPNVIVQPELPLISCNVILIEQALENLIDNAIKHCGKPESVAVRVYQSDNQVVFEVRDQGKGMVNASLTASDKVGGLGIGLKLCREVAGAHQGELKFLVTEPEGTCAQLKIPRLNQ
jgi:two-component system sensor histidine kinase KdpD